MHRLLENIKKELDCIEDKGLNTSNLHDAYTLLKMRKMIAEIQEKEKDGYEEESEMRYRGDYERSYSRYNDGYGRQSGGRGRYSADPYDQYYDKVDRMLDALDDYCYGRSRYRDGGSSEHMTKGLEEIMYSICTFVEALANTAETPADKEIIRKHIDKLKGI